MRGEAHPCDGHPTLRRGAMGVPASRGRPQPAWTRTPVVVAGLVVVAVLLLLGSRTNPVPRGVVPPVDERSEGGGTQPSGGDGTGELPRVRFETSKGDIIVVVYIHDAPKTAQNFIGLARKGYFDGIVFHRIIKVCA